MIANCYLLHEFYHRTPLIIYFVGLGRGNCFKQNIPAQEKYYNYLWYPVFHWKNSFQNEKVHFAFHVKKYGSTDCQSINFRGS